MTRLDVRKAKTLPSAVNVAARNINVIKIIPKSEEKQFLFSIGRAMRYAEFLKLGARDIDSPLVQSSLPIPNLLKSKVSRDTLVEEYSRISTIRGDELDFTLNEYITIRDTRLASAYYRDYIRSMGIKDERGLKFGDDLIGNKDG